MKSWPLLRRISVGWVMLWGTVLNVDHPATGKTVLTVTLNLICVDMHSSTVHLSVLRDVNTAISSVQLRELFDKVSSKLALRLVGVNVLEVKSLGQSIY